MMEELFVNLRLTSPPWFHRCAPNWTWRPPRLADWDLWLVLGGIGHMRLNGTGHDLRAGLCFALRPGDQLVATHDPRHRLQVFAAHFELCDAPGAPRPPSPDECLPPAVPLQDLALCAVLARACADAWREATPLGRERSRLFLRQILLQMRRDVQAPAPNPGDGRLRELLERVCENPGQAWSVARLAAAAHLSRSQLTRRCRREVGMAPAQWVIRARLDRARQLLRDTDMSIGEIAAALGYRDACYFSHQFRRLAGQTPRACRRGG